MTFLLWFLLLLLLATSNCSVFDNQQISIIESARSQKLESVNESCSPWKFDKYHNSSCECGSKLHGVVVCNNNQSTVLLLTCHCMSYSDNSDEILVGACMYLCNNNLYMEISANTNLNSLCNSVVHQNRKGQMCGKCFDNHSPAPYSYTLKCAQCSNYRYNWIKYLLIAFLPLTMFYVVVILFRFNAMSPPLNTYIFYCQIMSCPAVMSIFSNYAYYWNAVSNPYPHINLKLLTIIASTVYGIWNLDFFRMAYDPFCLHRDMSILQILSLDYLIAVYPLCLVCLTYLLVKVHDRFQIVQSFWKPMAWVFLRFSSHWNASNSLIEAFGTFFLLSYVKIINTSFDILMPVEVHNVTGQIVGLHLYHNGSLEYFGSEHIPYAVLAIFMLITFNLIPLLLLCFYPCRWFQSCLNCCRLNSQVLRTFMDAFQGCYKFEPYDCRYWAAFYLFLRIMVLIIFAFTESIFFIMVTGIAFIPAILLTATIRPYRHTLYNIADIMLYLMIVQVYFSFTAISYSDFDTEFKTFPCIMFGLALIIPTAYAIAMAVTKILPSQSLVVAGLKKCLLIATLRDKGVNECEGDPLLQNLADNQGV